MYTVRTAGAHQWSEALPQASHFVVSSSFSPLVTRCPLFTFLGLPLYLNVILPSLVPVRCLAPIQVASPKEQTDQNWFEFFLLRENWLGWDTFPSKLVRMCRSSLSGSGRFQCPLGRVLALFFIYDLWNSCLTEDLGSLTFTFFLNYEKIQTHKRMQKNILNPYRILSSSFKNYQPILTPMLTFGKRHGDTTHLPVLRSAGS